MLRVPGSEKDLLAVKAAGGDVRIVYSPLDAVRLAERNPDKQVVFFAVGFETTAPANAMSVGQAHQIGLKNYFLLCSHVLVPPAMEAILSSPANMGGHVKNPSYQMVCTDETGHAEVVQVSYDPSVITYEQLLDAFWQMHDPTTPDRQGFDFGSQYRSVIFCHDENQRTAAEASKKRLDESCRLGDPIVTEIVAAGPFYRAEEYHQRYLEKTGQEDHC